MNGKAKGAMVLAGVFVLGAIAGGGASYAHVQREAAWMLSDERGELREKRRLDAMSRELGLSSEQRTRVAEILRRNRKAHRHLKGEMLERCGDSLREHREKVESEIASVLDPEQQRHFDSLSEKHRKRFLHGGRKGRRGGKHRHEGRPGRPSRD